MSDELTQAEWFNGIIEDMLESKQKIADSWRLLGYIVLGQAEILDTLNVAQQLLNDGKMSYEWYIGVSAKVRKMAIDFVAPYLNNIE